MSLNLTDQSKEELISLLDRLKQNYAVFKKQNLNLDLTRGKPCSEQLDLANAMLDCINIDNCKINNIDTRNYGGVDGLVPVKELFARYLGVNKDEIIIGGNSSLNLMYDTIARFMLFGHQGEPWGKQEEIKILCPAPGYDRHFAISEHFNLKMLTVAMTPNGPDLDEVEKLVVADSAIKGIWCVPKYSNPTGVTFSDETVERLAKMQTAASDFCIFWDNAYAVHDLEDTSEELKNIFAACQEAGNPERVIIFGSTSKISFAGGGIGLMGGSVKNIAAAKKSLVKQTIGSDKINQLRHLIFFKDLNGIYNHMRKHAAIIKPKFLAVLAKLESTLADNLAKWSTPRGGYFISLDLLACSARQVIEMAATVGVKLTAAGATYPYGKDPDDSNIRIAPTFPSLAEIQQAMEVICLVIQICSIERKLQP